MDWALGFVGQLEPGEAGGSKDISTGAGYRTVLAVVGAKGQGGYGMTEAQVLGYMGCLYREREARGTVRTALSSGLQQMGVSGGFLCWTTRGHPVVWVIGGHRYQSEGHQNMKFFIKMTCVLYWG